MISRSPARSLVLPRFALAAPFALAALLGAVTTPSPAQACGGLFCSTSNPVNQVAERIVFAANANDTVTAAIEIQYEGPASEFAWVLPVPPGDVTVGVSSKQALDALQAASNPVYTLQTTFANCGGNGDMAATSGFLAPGSVQNAADSVESSVTVLTSGNVGPYDYVIIEVDASLSDRAEVAVEWLEENGFDVAGIGPEVLRIYLAQDMNLLAFRLSKTSDTGAIRPVLLTYPGERPMIPIQPTAVAAADDMGILVWVLGEGRAVPTNYLSLELNEARIDWLNPGPTYNDVVVAAADEAGGWGFVTEQAGDAAPFAESIYPSYKLTQWDGIRTGAFDTLDSFFQQVLGFAQAPFVNAGGSGGFGDVAFAPEYYDGFLEVMSDPMYVPLREGATAEQFINCVSCYFAVDVAVQNDAYPSTPYVPGEDPLDQMDVGLFLERFEELVIEPLAATRELFDRHEKVTRLYTTLSPEEMTIDPEFDINPELADVSNQHVAERVIHCDGASWTITLPQGHTVENNTGAWPIAVGEAEQLPFVARMMQLSSGGEGEVVIDNYDDITTALVELDVGGVDARSPVAQERGTVGVSDSSDGGSCTVGRAPGTSGTAWLALLGLGLSLLRRGSRNR